MIDYPWSVKAGTLLSQAVNALLCGGHPDQSLSARAYAEQHDSPGWRRVAQLADRIFGAGHCQAAYESDILFALDILDPDGLNDLPPDVDA
jgi:hypothetical protein